MRKAFIQESTLRAIADAIREKNGSNETYTPIQMADAISAITTSGSVSSQEKHDVLCFETDENGATINLNCNKKLGVNLQYSYDNIEWVDWVPFVGDDYYSFKADIQENEKLYIRGDNVTLGISNEIYSRFDIEGNVFVSGNIQSLLTYDGNSEYVPDYCYYRLFSDCEYLCSAPSLNGTKLGKHCYDGMFCGCSGLKIFKSLPATTLAESCYESMFEGCESLHVVPTMPATMLAPSCYKCMFKDCISIEDSPVLPAENPVSDCYYEMFYGCVGLKYINAMLLEFGDEYTTNWVYGVSDEDSFLFIINRNFDYENVEPSDNTFKERWGIKNNVDFSNWHGLLLTAVGCSVSVNFAYDSYDNPLPKTIEYSDNGDENWREYTTRYMNEVGNDSFITLHNGQSVALRGSGTSYGSANCANRFVFGGEGFVEASGNINSLINNGTSITSYGFKKLFFNCKNLISAPELPAISVSNVGYYQMFQNCSNLVVAPELPATSINGWCYANMFKNCTSLVKAQTILPANLNGGYCYHQMFNGCISLEKAPMLPSTTLTEHCYSQMFYGCTSLEKAPTLPSETLSANCYTEMFRNCSNLNHIEVFVTNWNTAETQNWVLNVSTNGVFIKPEELEIREGPSGIPTGWTVENFETIQ